jgi:hypothetical protein
VVTSRATILVVKGTGASAVQSGVLAIVAFALAVWAHAPRCANHSCRSTGVRVGCGATTVGFRY